VLAHERGARYPRGISILVASDVPEGACRLWLAGRVGRTHEAAQRWTGCCCCCRCCRRCCSPAQHAPTPSPPPCLRRRRGSAGKGVSSSAALEVAVMSAVAAAHGIELRGRELALLCQKAEVRR
jgi:hypothetical protein